MILYRYISLLILIFFGFSLFSQSSPEYGNFNKEVVFEEEFEGEVNFFELTGENFSFSDGVISTSKSKNTQLHLLSFRSYQFKDTDNYDIEFIIKDDFSSHSTVQLFWKSQSKAKGIKGKFQEVHLYIYSRKVKFYGRFGSSEVVIDNEKIFEYFEPGKFNKVTIRYIDNKYNLFINEEYVGQILYDIPGPFKLEFHAFDLSMKLQKLGVYLIKDECIPESEVLVLDNEVIFESVGKAKYHALIIGNNNYQDPNLNDLDQPISDATKLYNVLTTKYTFDKENVTFIKDATRRDMIAALDKLSNTLTHNDNLLIFYAGHGDWNESKEIGSWLPVDAERDITVNWFKNSAVQEYIEIIDSKHTLLITDACFGGGIFKTRAAFDDADRSINNLYKYESRKAMTSGMLNEVPDKSVFMENLIERLNDNEQKYISSSDLFMQFRNNVMNNSNNSPQYGTVHNTGDKGGDFIFIRREN